MANMRGGGGLDRAIALSQRYGMEAMFIKEADEGLRWQQITPAMCDELRSAGIRPVAWTYLYGNDWVAAADAVVDIALYVAPDGIIIDAEGEVERRSAVIPHFCQYVRDRLPDYPLAVAPLPVMEYHEQLQYQTWYDHGFDFLPQWYTNVLSDEFDLDYLLRVWSERFPMDKVFPAFGMYSATGYPGDAGARHPTSAELREFHDRTAAAGCPGTSYWRLDTIDPDVWAGA